MEKKAKRVPLETKSAFTILVFLGYLQNLTSQVLPGLSLVEVEAKFFSRILPEVLHCLSQIKKVLSKCECLFLIYFF